MMHRQRLSLYLMKGLCLAPAEWPLLISAQKAASHTGQNPRFGRRTPELHHDLLAPCLKLANNGGLAAKLLYMWLFRWSWECSCCGPGSGAVWSRVCVKEGGGEKALSRAVL